MTRLGFEPGFDWALWLHLPHELAPRRLRGLKREGGLLIAVLAPELLDQEDVTLTVSPGDVMLRVKEQP